jgi:hypothetical protein
MAGLTAGVSRMGSEVTASTVSATVHHAES